jgi:predicted amidophosphoribosyltransferase
MKDLVVGHTYPCDCCGEVAAQEGKFCPECTQKAKEFEALVEKVEGFARGLQEQGYSHSQIVGALESVSEILAAE